MKKRISKLLSFKFDILTCNKLTRQGYWEVYDFVQIPGFGDIVQWQYCPLTHASVGFLVVFRAGGIICIKHGRTYCVSWWEKVATCKWVKSNNLFIWSVRVDIWKHIREWSSKNYESDVGYKIVKTDQFQYHPCGNSWSERTWAAIFSLGSLEFHVLTDQRAGAGCDQRLWPKVWPKEAEVVPPPGGVAHLGARISLEGHWTLVNLSQTFCEDF